LKITTTREKEKIMKAALAVVVGLILAIAIAVTLAKTLRAPFERIETAIQTTQQAERGESK